MHNSTQASPATAAMSAQTVQTMELVRQDLMVALANDTLDLPTLPEVAIQVRELGSDPDVTVPAFARLIQQDPALTGRLVGVANSPILRGVSTIKSVEQAIGRLGIGFSTNLATGFAMEQMFQATSELVDSKMREIWSQSTEVAAYATVLTRLYTRLSPDRALLAGLTHSIGSLPILAWLEMHDEVEMDATMLDCIIEALHPKLGAAILAHWEFPPELVDIPVAHRNYARSAEKADYADVITIAYLQQRRMGVAEDADWSGITALGRLGLDDDFADESFTQSSQEIAKVMH